MTKEAYAAWRAECCKADIEIDSMSRGEYIQPHTKGRGRKRVLTDAERAERRRQSNRKSAHKKTALRLASEKRQQRKNINNIVNLKERVCQDEKRCY